LCGNLVGAARTNFLRSNPAEQLEKFQTIGTTKGSSRLRQGTPIEDTGSHRLRKTIYSARDEIGIDMAISEATERHNFQIWLQSARRWESVFLPQALYRYARTCCEQPLARVRTASTREIRTSTKNQLCRRTSALYHPQTHVYRTSHVCGSVQGNSACVH